MDGVAEVVNGLITLLEDRLRSEVSHSLTSGESRHVSTSASGKSRHTSASTFVERRVGEPDVGVVAT